MTDYQFVTPDEAEQAFYDAFEQADITKMMSVWEKSDHSICIHPLTGHISGWESITKSWDQIFNHSPGITIRLSDKNRTLSTNLAVHVLYEHIQISAEEQPQVPVIATNVYQLGKNGWHMILHHASPTASSTPIQDQDIITLH